MFLKYLTILLELFCRTPLVLIIKSVVVFGRQIEIKLRIKLCFDVEFTVFMMTTATTTEYIKPYLFLLNGEDPAKAVPKYDNFIREIGGSGVDVNNFRGYFHSWEENANKDRGVAGVILFKDGNTVKMQHVRLTYGQVATFSI